MKKTIEMLWKDWKKTLISKQSDLGLVCNFFFYVYGKKENISVFHLQSMKLTLKTVYRLIGA